MLRENEDKKKENKRRKKEEKMPLLQIPQVKVVDMAEARGSEYPVLVVFLDKACHLTFGQSSIEILTRATSKLYVFFSSTTKENTFLDILKVALMETTWRHEGRVPLAQYFE